MPAPAIRAANITRTYGDRRALDGFSLEVPAGSVFGLLGPNGSGKSTFIALLAAAQSPASGTLEVLGQAPSPGLRVRMATVFQENSADLLMRTAEYMHFSGRLFGLPRGDVGARARELLATFGLGERARDPVGTLSGGMRRRLEVARALMHRPELLILDEPTTGVDAEERAVLWANLRAASDGVTILLATNDLVEADAVCDRVAFLRAGRVVASGTPAELKTGLRRESVRVTWHNFDSNVLPRLAALPGTGEITQDGDTTIVATDDAASFVPRMFELTPGLIRSVAIGSASLEDAYFQHVGRRPEGSAK
jgi:ABC-2 type transport system ATP-binding protein